MVRQNRGGPDVLRRDAEGRMGRSLTFWAFGDEGCRMLPGVVLGKGLAGVWDKRLGNGQEVGERMEGACGCDGCGRGGGGSGFSHGWTRMGKRFDPAQSKWIQVNPS
jgi:hypothetical protein